MVRSKNRKNRRRSKTLLTLCRAISQPPPNKMASYDELDKNQSGLLEGNEVGDLAEWALRTFQPRGKHFLSDLVIVFFIEVTKLKTMKN